MSKIKALEKLFGAEIEGRLPLQSKAKIYTQLCDEGLAQPSQKVFGSGWSAVTVEGYELTHAGRFLYCSQCPTPPDDAAAAPAGDTGEAR